MYAVLRCVIQGSVVCLLLILLSVNNVILFVQSVGSQTASSQFTDFDPHTQSQTIPISSTPYEDIESHGMQPPRYVCINYIVYTSVL